MASPQTKQDRVFIDPPGIETNAADPFAHLPKEVQPLVRLMAKAAEFQVRLTMVMVGAIFTVQYAVITYVYPDISHIDVIKVFIVTTVIWAVIAYFRKIKPDLYA